jgi:hypothetical protein
MREQASCLVCFAFGRLASWVVLIFGGIVGGLPKLGFAAPSLFWEKCATYLMALGLLQFAISYILLRFMKRPVAR